MSCEELMRGFKNKSVRRGRIPCLRHSFIQSFHCQLRCVLKRGLENGEDRQGLLTPTGIGG
jgi:hypothetical protein